MKKNPYQIIKNRHVTEKASVLTGLCESESNASVRRCETPKYVFVVDTRSNKQEIKSAIEEIYPQVRVSRVNTIMGKQKKRRVRGRLGYRKAIKKAIVSLRPGDTIDTEE